MEARLKTEIEIETTTNSARDVFPSLVGDCFFTSLSCLDARSLRIIVPLWRSVARETKPRQRTRSGPITRTVEPDCWHFLFSGWQHVLRFNAVSWILRYLTEERLCRYGEQTAGTPLEITIETTIKLTSVFFAHLVGDSFFISIPCLGSLNTQQPTLFGVLWRTVARGTGTPLKIKVETTTNSTPILFFLDETFLHLLIMSWISGYLGFFVPLWGTYSRTPLESRSRTRSPLRIATSSLWTSSRPHWRQPQRCKNPYLSLLLLIMNAGFGNPISQVLVTLKRTGCQPLHLIQCAN